MTPIIISSGKKSKKSEKNDANVILLKMYDIAYQNKFMQVLQK